jgi:hypothetical protein
VIPPAQPSPSSKLRANEKLQFASLVAFFPFLLPGENHDSRSRSASAQVGKSFFKGMSPSAQSSSLNYDSALLQAHLGRFLFRLRTWEMCLLQSLVTPFYIFCSRTFAKRRFRHFLLFICDRSGLFLTFLRAPPLLSEKRHQMRGGPLSQNTLLSPLSEIQTNLQSFILKSL